jgi:16S rRNA (cytosine967-C5)-methyltransferase
MAHLHLRQSAELLELILGGMLPADSQMERFFRAHRAMGVRDRGLVAETVYGCLRHRRLLEYLCGRTDLPCLVAAQLLSEGLSARALEQAGYGAEARTLAERVRTLDASVLPFAARHSLPDWLAERLLAQYSEAEALAAALNRPAPVDLRVNTLKAARTEVQARLAEEGFACEPTPYSPAGLRRHDRAPLFRTRAFQDGLFEVQDEGSQLLAPLLEPRRHEMVVDFCAGGGGKTLQLGALMANTGTLYAFDVSPRRLEKLRPRLARAGLNNVRAVTIAHERDERVQRLHGKMDRVLVDAPCSGTGTLRRNPDIKWRRLDLAALTAAQGRILAAAAELVKPGGRLVYATCSLLREENDDIAADFLATHPSFHPIPAGEILARRQIPLEMDSAALRLSPHHHGTDGFYAVALERGT